MELASWITLQLCKSHHNSAPCTVTFMILSIAPFVGPDRCIIFIFQLERDYIIKEKKVEERVENLTGMLNNVFFHCSFNAMPFIFEVLVI